VRFTLKNYQLGASADVTKALRRATKYVDDDPSERWAVILSAPTGAGKTVIASSVIETLFDGAGSFGADPDATVLWVTDDPALNAQTARNMMQASSTLGPNRLTTINSGFDQEMFETNQVYFLNIQKLAKTNPLSKSNVDGRTYSLWETIANTIAAIGAHFYVVIDEAHRGSNPYSDRVTIVSRIINGQTGVNPPAPVVWGISATPDRFAKAMATRSTTPVTRGISSCRAIRR
jgi:type III restriction enzyme